MLRDECSTQHPSFFWYDNDSGYQGPFCVTQPMCNISISGRYCTSDVVINWRPLSPEFSCKYYTAILNFYSSKSQTSEWFDFFYFCTFHIKTTSKNAIYRYVQQSNVTCYILSICIFYFRELFLLITQTIQKSFQQTVSGTMRNKSWPSLK